MGIAERKEREREGRRELIREKAKELVLEKGVAAHSMQELADAAELSKATLYLYFASKEALLSEILKEAADSLMDYFERRVTPAASGIETIRTIWKGYLEIFGSSNDIFVLVGIKNYIDPLFPLAFPGHEEREDESTRRFVGLIERAIGRGIADGTLDPTQDAEKLARRSILIATSIVDKVANLPRGARDPRLISEELRGIFELLLRGLSARDTDPALLRLDPVGPADGRNG